MWLLRRTSGFFIREKRVTDADAEFGPATDADLGRLEGWFESALAARRWGGPAIRYPFAPGRLREDIRFADIDSFALRNRSADLLAFGQVYERHGRIHLARLVVDPARRGSGLGHRLLAEMLRAGRERYLLTEYSLYVYADNAAAMALYHGAGFREAAAPVGDARLADCLYLVRPVR